MAHLTVDFLSEILVIYVMKVLEFCWTSSISPRVTYISSLSSGTSILSFLNNFQKSCWYMFHISKFPMEAHWTKMATKLIVNVGIKKLRGLNVMETPFPSFLLSTQWWIFPGTYFLTVYRLGRCSYWYLTALFWNNQIAP